MQIRYGSNNRQIVKNIAYASDCKLFQNHDVGPLLVLLYLDSPVQLSEDVQTIQIANETFTPGAMATAYGWGGMAFRTRLITNHLRKVELVTLTNEDCDERFDLWSKDRGTFCAVPPNGDDGGVKMVCPKKTIFTLISISDLITQ